MKTRRSRYHGHRFPAEIIGHAVWLYHRFCLSFRDVEDLLAERGIIVSYGTIRHWCQKFGPDYARKLKRRQGRLGGTWHLDELFVRINGEQHYLWRAVDQDGANLIEQVLVGALYTPDLPDNKVRCALILERTVPALNNLIEVIRRLSVRISNRPA